MFFQALFIGRMFSFHCNDIFYEVKMIQVSVFFILGIVASAL